MIFNFPLQDKLANYNIIQVFFKNAADNPVCLRGKVINAYDDAAELVLETEKEFGTFVCDTIAGVRFGVEE